MDGFVLHLGGGCYRFLHDRLQQAAYLFNDEISRKMMHLRIGRSLSLKVKDDSQLLFDVVHHLNIAIDEMKDQNERMQVCTVVDGIVDEPCDVLNGMSHHDA